MQIVTCIAYEHDLTLVALAAVTCVIGAWITVTLFVRARANLAGSQALWVFLGGTTAGATAWCMHFIAMLGFLPGIRVEYDPYLTGMSLLIGIIASTVAFAVGVRRHEAAPDVAGAIFALGVVGLHYCGMAAFAVDGVTFWDFRYIAASIGSPVLFGVLAFNRAARPAFVRNRHIAVGGLVLAIVCLHFTAMAALTVMPSAPAADAITNETARWALATAVVGVGFLLGICFLSYVLDRQTRAEAAARLLESEAATIAKGQFLATVSHEVRTPMNGVIGMLNLLLRSGLDERQEKYATVARESAIEMVELLNDILDFSKLEACEIRLEEVVFSPRTVVEHVVTGMSTRAEEKGLRLSASVADTAAHWVRGDPTRLRQVLTNLVGNAVKFTEAGEVAIVARASARSDQVQWRFEVRDTGVGIAKDVQPRLFERFVQADLSTTRRFGGTGLGLAICKQLVALMGGQIGVVSEPGRGSVFWFTLPAKIAEAPEQEQGALEPDDAEALVTA
jgi:signal transduction histidine kinase